jgi:hypothetical protein
MIYQEAAAIKVLLVSCCYREYLQMRSNYTSPLQRTEEYQTPQLNKHNE